MSDLHLHADLRRTTDAFRQYLQQTRADAVIILGDLFEAWVGDDMRHEDYEASCVALLSGYGSRGWLGMMVGNRDFLLGPDMVNDCQANALSDPTLLSAFHQTFLLTHGDALCLADTDYLRFRAQVRNPTWQAAFLSKPLPERLAIAQQMRMASAAHQKHQPVETWADVDALAANHWLDAASAGCMVHGHTHRPGIVALDAQQSRSRVVLSDWDLDHATPPRGDILRLTSAGLKRVPLAEA